MKVILELFGASRNLSDKDFLEFNIAYSSKHSALDKDDKLGTFFPAITHLAAPSTRFPFIV